MKTTRRAIGILLSLAMLIGLLPLAVFTASAAVEAIPLTYQEAVTVTLGVGESKWYSFTPDTTGPYMFVSSDEVDVDPVASLYDSTMQEIVSNDDDNGSNFAVISELTAGETYYLEVYEFDMNNEGSYSLLVTKAFPTDVFLDEYSVKSFVGAEYATTAHIYPENTDDTLIWTSSDESVATVDDNGVVRFLSAGEVSITVETINGLSDTCWFEVEPVHGSLTLGEEKEIVYAEGKETRKETQQFYTFTPDETGYYRWYSYDILSDPEDTQIDPRAWVFNELHDELEYDDDGGEDVNVSVEAALTAGVTYYFMVELYDSQATGSFKIKLEEMVTAESVSIDSDDRVMEQGESLDMYVTYAPEGCWQEDYSVTSSDESVVRIEEKTVYAVGEGEATVTVTTELGLTDSITVTVIGVDALELDTPYTLEGNADSSGAFERYTFMPDEAGLYTITSSSAVGEGATVAVGLNNSYEQLRYNNTGTDSFALTYALEAGKTYYYDVTLNCEAESSSVGFMVTKLADETIPSAVINRDYDIEIDNPGDGVYYAFTPVATGLYAVFSTDETGGLDTKLNVYNSEWELFYSNDDGGDNGQFRLEEEFIAGETYYLKSKFYGDNITGRFVMRIEPLFTVEGDITGDFIVDMEDAFPVYMAAATGDVPENVISFADMNGDGIIDMADAFAVYKKASGETA